MGRICCARFERAARKRGYLRVAGIDEAGRGALFGPVVAAAVILNPRRRIVGLDDSKKLTAKRRAALAARIIQHALAWAVAQVEPRRIDAWNILEASRQAMSDAIAGLALRPDYLLIDAVSLELSIEQKAIVHGDARSISIAAASILAKQARDRLMEEWDGIYPQYGLGRNKGYATADHLAALRRHGPSPEHRFSFLPVREALPEMGWGAEATQGRLPLAAPGPAPAR